ncbi:MAG: hypothetical protein DLM58_21620 [Pseudonocardiales bacterium]|nr:MAG: hypothetical protein DLM58_21620 [Pseudonocardiales bacterium]
MTSPQQPATYPASPYPGYVLMPAQPPKNRVGIVGAVVTVLGALTALAGTALHWYSVGGIDIDLHDIEQATSPSGAKALPHTYFGWLLWVLLALTIVAALLANVPGPLSTTLRVLSPLLGVLSVILLLASLGQLQRDRSVFDDATVGLWAIVIGFIVTGFGGVFGPRRH